ncbi:MAG: BatD family protein [Planctomycetota bacterium]|nr:BatD family protein [Planctomycetota bacterium]
MGKGRARQSIRAAFFVIAAALAGPAAAQEVGVSVASTEIYADLPFILSVTAKGFEEKPEPTIADLEIPGCKVVFISVSPSVTSFISIFGRRQSERRDVSFVFNYSVTPSKPGSYTVPAIEVSQGPKKATTRPSTFRALEVAETDEMKLILTLPDRPVWVGETFPLTIDWFIRRDVREQAFAIPLFEMEDLVDVSPPPGEPKRAAIDFPAGARVIRLPFERERVPLEGGTFTRFRFRALVTPTRSGTIDLPPGQVVAEIHVGTGRDRFGFASKKYRLAKAVDRPLRLEVRASPEAGRPESFSGAVGTGFGIDVEADRTVVRLGDPVTLVVTIRGDGRLDGLGLPPLDVDGGLSPELFSFPDESPPGEMLDDGGKRFVVSVRVRSERAAEIPALPFSFFNPISGVYQTVRSRPIALAVKSSALVGAKEVVSAATEPETSAPSVKPATDETREIASPTSLVGANLSLSDSEDTLRKTRGIRGVLPFALFLYAAPLLLLGWRTWSLRTRKRRSAAREIRRAGRRCLDAIDEASRVPAPEGAPRIASAMQSLRKLRNLPQEEGQGLLRDLEVAAFDPAAASSPLPDALCNRAREMVRDWSRGPAPAGVRTALLWMPIVGAALMAAPASAEEAQSTAEAYLQGGREAYREAMVEMDRDRRVAGFARAADLFGRVAREYPESPELLADWGCSALGAQDIGGAVLAFRRALRLDPDHPRARKNLAWARDRMPAWVPVPAGSGALDSLHLRVHSLSVPQRIFGGAAGFALVILLVMPWGSHDRLRRRLAILPALVWLGLSLSVVLDPGVARDRVVLRDGATLRSADSVGAPPVLGRPLPAGVEVTAIESRDSWTRIELADGTAGWLSESVLGEVEVSSGSPRP